METLKYSVDLSGSAYTQVEKALESEIGNKRRGKRGGSTKVMYVKAITIEWMNETAARADGDSQMVQITTNSEAAEVKIGDKDCFFKAKRMYEGIVLQMNELVMRYPVELPYIKKTMYIGIDVVGIAEATASIDLQIEFEYRYVNDYVLSRIIARRV